MEKKRMKLIYKEEFAKQLNEAVEYAGITLDNPIGNEQIDYDTGYFDGLNSAVAMLNKAKTVDAEPVRHGKWTRENKYGTWECNVCGCKVNRANPLKGNIWNYYYCPNCGARMDGCN